MKKGKKGIYIAITGGALLIAAVLMARMTLFGGPEHSRPSGAHATRRGSGETVPLPTPPPEEGPYSMEMSNAEISELLLEKISQTIAIESIAVAFSESGEVYVTLDAPRDDTIALVQDKVDSAARGALKLISMVAPKTITIELDCKIEVKNGRIEVKPYNISLFNQKFSPDLLPENVQSSVQDAINEMVLKEGYEATDVTLTSEKIIIEAAPLKKG